MPFATYYNTLQHRTTCCRVARLLLGEDRLQRRVHLAQCDLAVLRAAAIERAQAHCRRRGPIGLGRRYLNLNPKLETQNP